MRRLKKIINVCIRYKQHKIIEQMGSKENVKQQFRKIYRTKVI